MPIRKRGSLVETHHPEVASTDMGYKVLGFVVWQGSKWYLRRRLSGTKSKVAILGAGVLVLAGVALAGRQATSNQ